MPPVSKRLLLVRHGQTAWNKERRIQGQADAPLDETGLAQAAAVAPAIAAHQPALIWSSDLARAAVTADHIASACDLPVTRDTRLRELSFGERQGLTHEEYRQLAPEEFDAVFGHGDYAAIAGGEKPSELMDRTATCLRELLAATPDGATAVGVAHGLAIGYAIAGLLGWDEDVVGTLHGMDNCGWAELAADASGRLRLCRYNLRTPIS